LKENGQNNILHRILVTDLDFSAKTRKLLHKKNVSSLLDLVGFLNKELPNLYSPKQQKTEPPSEAQDESNFNINLLRELKELNLSERAKNCLRKNNIKFVGDLVQIPEHKLMKFKNFGRKTLEELKKKLSRYSLRFGMKICSWDRKDELLRKHKHELLSLREQETSRSIEQFLGNEVRTVEDEIRGIIYLLEIKKKDWEEIFILRYGLNGEKSKTLQEIASIKGVTRERIRQIEAKVLEKFNSTTTITTPVIDLALKECSEQTNVITGQEIEKILFEKGLTKGTANLHVLISLSEILKKKISFSVVEYEGKEYMIPEKYLPFKKVISKAKNYSGKYGAAYLEDVQENLRKEEINYSKEEIAKLLILNHNFTWLNREDEYFYFKNLKRNRLVNSIRKIFSVTNALNADSLKSALRRNYRITRTPSTHILLKICSELDGFEVNNNIITSKIFIDQSSELSEIELKLFNIFTVHGPLLNRPEIERLTKDEINDSSLSIYLGYSTIIRRYDTGVYGLINSNVSLADITAKRMPDRKNRIYQDSGWTTDAKIWIIHKVTDALLNKGMYYIPAALKDEIINGNYTAYSSELDVLDTLTVKDSNCWNFKKSLKKLGADQEDYLLTKWDKSNNRLYLYLGDKEALFEKSEDYVSFDNKIDSGEYL
jgi:hypothetical protein